MPRGIETLHRAALDAEAVFVGVAREALRRHITDDPRIIGLLAIACLEDTAPQWRPQVAEPHR